MATTLTKSIWVFLLVAGAAVLVFVAATGPGRDRPVRISVTHAARQELSSWTTGNGKVEPIEPHVIQAQLSTRISAVYVREGQMVKAGDPLLSLTPQMSKANWLACEISSLVRRKSKKPHFRVAHPTIWRRSRAILPKQSDK